MAFTFYYCLENIIWVYSTFAIRSNSCATSFEAVTQFNSHMLCLREPDSYNYYERIDLWRDFSLLPKLQLNKQYHAMSFLAS
jgi:hypothetical protein